jgi:hypothetical protein
LAHVTLAADIFYNPRVKLLFFLLVAISSPALACNDGIIVGVTIRNDTAEAVVVGRCGYEDECGKKLMDRTVLRPGDANFGVNAARYVPANVRIQDEAGNDIGCLRLDYAELTPNDGKAYQREVLVTDVRPCD